MNIKELKMICQKNDDEIFITDKLIFRKLSIYTTKLFIKLKISPNVTTLLSLFFALCGSLFLMSNNKNDLIIASICVFIYWMLDYVDGELARYYIYMKKQNSSLQGAYFDYLVHFFSSNIMFLSIGYSSYIKYDNALFLIIGTIACIGISNFPNLVASMIISKNINSNVETLIISNQKKILLLLDDGQKGKEAILNNNMFNRIVQLIKEIFLFPGCLNMIIIVSLIDGLFNNNISILGFNFRTLYLMFFGIIMLVNTIRKSTIWINKMKDVS